MFSIAVAATLLAATPELIEGRRQYTALSWSKAAELLSVAAADPKNSKAERIEAYDLVARAYIAAGKTALARAAYEALVDLEPMAADPEDSPKVRVVFREAKERRYGPRYVKLERRASSGAELVVDVVNPWRLPLTFALEETTDPKRAPKVLEARASQVTTTLGKGAKAALVARFSDGSIAAQLGSAAEPLEGPPGAAAPVARVTPAPAAAVSTTEAPSPSRAWVGPAAVGLAGFVGFGVTFGLAAGQWSAIQESTTLPQAESIARTGDTLQWASRVSLGIGIAGALTALVLWLVVGRS